MLPSRCRALCGVLAWLFALAASFWTRPAAAWLKVSVEADNVVVQISSDGSARIEHEVLLRVRGGPLQQWTLNGIDPDATPDGAASIVKASSGQQAGLPLPLEVQHDAELLHLNVIHKKAIYSGTYLVRFAYRTNLAARGLLRKAGDTAEVRWTGPLFEDGIDSLQTTFVVPRASRPPALAGEETDPALGLNVQPEGVFLSQLQRAAELDRLVLSRPHAAKHERVVWRAAIDAQIFGELGAQPDAVNEQAAPAIEPLSPPAQTGGPLPWQRALQWLVYVTLGAFYALCVGLKRRLRQTTYVLPVPKTVWRQPLIAACLATSLWCALEPEWATAAGALLCVAMLLALQKPTHVAPQARGPGRWQPVDLAGVALPIQVQDNRGRWLDANNPRGGALLLVGLVGFTVFGLRLLGSAPYHSAMALVYSAALIPLFFTLGTGTPETALESERDFLLQLQHKLQKQVRRKAPAFKGVQVQGIARYALGAEIPDELRLRLELSRSVQGLLSLEVGLGFAQGSFGRLAMPSVIVRVRDGSEAHRATPRDAEWSRGRDSEERVAVVRPSLPLPSATLETLVELLAALQRPARQRPQAAAIPRVQSTKQLRQVVRQR